MKILYCSDILNVHDQALLEGFGNSGHDVAVGTFYQKADQLPGFARKFRVFREVLRAYPDGLRGSRNRLFRALQYRREERRAVGTLKRWLDEYQPDVVYACWAITMGYISALAGVRNLALFPWGSDILLMPGQRRWFRKRTVHALRSAHMWVFDAHHTAKRAGELAGLSKPTEVLPCYHDPDEFTAARADRAFFEERWPGKRIVMSSRPLKELYNVETAVRAMKDVDAVLFVAGDGPLRPNLQSIATGNVHFAGMVEHAKLPELLAACDVYVSASTTDSLSVGVLEAMSCERPVAASDIPANRECIEEGVSGRIFRTRDPADCAQKIREVLENPGEMGRRGREWTVEHADRKKNFPKLIAALERLVENRRG